MDNSRTIYASMNFLRFLILTSLCDVGEDEIYRFIRQLNRKFYFSSRRRRQGDVRIRTKPWRRFRRLSNVVLRRRRLARHARLQSNDGTVVPGDLALSRQRSDAAEREKHSARLQRSRIQRERAVPDDTALRIDLRGNVRLRACPGGTDT